MLLRQELKESDIPGRTTIRNRVEKSYNDYIKQLEEEMMVCELIYFSGKITDLVVEISGENILYHRHMV